MRAMRLLFLNRSFWPDIEATGQFLTELCEDLSLRGHKITIVSGPPYHVATKRVIPWTRDSHGAVAIVRTWGTRFSKRRLATRMMNLATYYVLAALAVFAAGRPDIVIAATDPPLLGALGAILKRWWGCGFVYNVRDLYPDIARVTGGVKNRALLRLLEVSNKMAYESADSIVALGNDMADRIVRKGVASAKVSVVTDWADCELIRPVDKSALREEFRDRFIVMYSGNLGLSQQLETVLDAASLLTENRRIVFLLVGDGVRKNWLQDRARELGLDNVRFLPYQPRERLADSLSAADAHLIALLPGTAGCVVPSKIYGILAAGRPVIAMMDQDSEVANLVNKYQVGKVVTPGDAQALATAISEASKDPERIERMQSSARRLALEKFERKTVTGQFAEVIEMVAARRREAALAAVAPIREASPI
jgi:glycosyltransferase involved in cell wall biosynthesis